MSKYPVTEVLMHGGIILTLYGVTENEMMAIGNGSMPNRMARRYPDLQPVSFMHIREKPGKEFAPSSACK